MCNEIDENSLIRHRLFREACVYHQFNLIKDLSCLGRDIDQICIVDNSPVAFLFQPSNAVSAKESYNNDDDGDDMYIWQLLALIIIRNN